MPGKRECNYLSDLQILADGNTVTINTRIGPPGVIRCEMSIDGDTLVNRDDLMAFFDRADVLLSGHDRINLAIDICIAAGRHSNTACND